MIGGELNTEDIARHDGSADHLRERLAGAVPPLLTRSLHRATQVEVHARRRISNSGKDCSPVSSVCVPSPVMFAYAGIQQEKNDRGLVIPEVRFCDEICADSGCRRSF